MKITIVNGSARKGNTLAAIEAFTEGTTAKHKIEVIQADKLDMRFCKGNASKQALRAAFEPAEGVGLLRSTKIVTHTTDYYAAKRTS